MRQDIQYRPLCGCRHRFFKELGKQALCVVECEGACQNKGKETERSERDSPKANLGTF